MVKEIVSVDTVTVYKLDENGRIVWQYPAEVCERSGEHVCLVAFFNRDDIDLGYTVFKRGDRFVEYFYVDRWFNIFAVYDRDTDSLKGWYCNVCRPAKLSATAVTCEDLALDVWVTPTGQTTILDEEEFDALNIGEADRKNGRLALKTLLDLAQAGQLPK